MFSARSILIGAIGFILFSAEGDCQSARVASERCEDSAAYSMNTTIFMIDKTTNLSQSDKQSWQLNTSHLFDDASILGRIILIEIKDSSVSYTIAGPFCIPPTGVRAPESISQIIPSFEWSWAWLRENLLPWLWLEFMDLCVWAMSALNANPYSGVNLNDQRATQKLIIARSKVRAAVVELASQDHESPATDIRDPLFSVLSVYCAQQSRCSLYIFSDFIDSGLVKMIKRGDQSIALKTANEDFDRLSNEYKANLSHTVLSITAWGVGRDEISANIALNPKKRIVLKQYWATIFNRFCSSALSRGSSVSLADIFSPSMGKGC